MSGVADSAVVVKRVTAGLLAGVVVCVLLALMLFVWTGGTALRVPWLNVQVLPEDPRLEQPKDDEILQRPLFWDSRRPMDVAQEAPAEQVVEQVEALAGVKLLGIIVRDSIQSALLEVDGKPGRYAPGDTVKQWQVAEVGGQVVRFASPRGETVLTLEREIHKGIRLEP
ncbi:MAG: hypothetical protein GX665_09630 [Gammaproteobacteria bacterium]|nr:hypothetical protein [Gammaproteobacteria bacterium]